MQQSEKTIALTKNPVVCVSDEALFTLSNLVKTLNLWYSERLAGLVGSQLNIKRLKCTETSKPAAIVEPDTTTAEMVQLRVNTNIEKKLSKTCIFVVFSASRKEITQVYRFLLCKI